MTLDEIRRMAQAAADQLPEDPDCADKPPSERTDDEWAELGVADDARHAAGVVLAEAAGFDEQLLESARPGIDVGRWPQWGLVVFSALCHAQCVNTPDDARARQLAGKACWGIPGSRHAYERRHAEMALEMLDDLMWRREMRRLRETGLPHEGATLEQARLWLTEFAAG